MCGIKDYSTVYVARDAPLAKLATTQYYSIDELLNMDSKQLSEVLGKNVVIQE